MARADDLAEALLAYVAAVPGADPKDAEAVRLAVAQAIVDYTVGEDDLPAGFDPQTPGWETGALTVDGTVLHNVLVDVQTSWVFRFSNTTTLMEIEPAGTFHVTADHGTNQRWENAHREAPRLIAKLEDIARPKIGEMLQLEVTCQAVDLATTTAGTGAITIGFLCHDTSSSEGRGWIGVQLIKTGTSTKEIRGVYNNGVSDTVFTSDSVSSLWFTVGSQIRLEWYADNAFRITGKQDLDVEYTTVGEGVFPELYPVAVFLAIAHDDALDPETPESEIYASSVRIFKY